MEEKLKFIAYNKTLGFNIEFEMIVKSNGKWCIADVYKFFATKLGLNYRDVCNIFHIRKYTDVLPKYAKNKPIKNIDNINIKIEIG